MDTEEQQADLTSRCQRYQAVKPGNSNQTQRDKQNEMQQFTPRAKRRMLTGEQHQGFRGGYEWRQFQNRAAPGNLHDHPSHTAQAAPNLPAYSIQFDFSQKPRLVQNSILLSKAYLGVVQSNLRSSRASTALASLSIFKLGMFKSTKKSKHKGWESGKVWILLKSQNKTKR